MLLGIEGVRFPRESVTKGYGSRYLHYEGMGECHFQKKPVTQNLNHRIKINKREITFAVSYVIAAPPMSVFRRRPSP